MNSQVSKQYEISDPEYYVPLITRQKAQTQKKPCNAANWLELGRLHEARIDMIKHMASRSFLVRYAHWLYILFILLGACSIYQVFNILSLPQETRIFITFAASIVYAALTCIFINSRYPKSGIKYFKRALDCDQDCGEAYMYMGLIALRRHRKRLACNLLERAIQLKVENKRVTRELKSIYEQEFVKYFNREKLIQTKQKEIIDNQLEEIDRLSSKLISSEQQIESLCGKARQVRWETSRKVKLLDKEMVNRIGSVRHAYEKQITALKHKNKLNEASSEKAEQKLVAATTEIMEKEALIEGRSFINSSKKIRDITGDKIWKALPDQTRTYLVTAEQAYNALRQYEEKADFSLVGMELCKALETEINRTLVTPFKDHIKCNLHDFLRINKTGDKNGLPTYFTYLSMVVDDHNYSEVNFLTLGQYLFVLKQSLREEYALEAYCNFLDKICDVSGVAIGSSFLKKLETVTKKYRNTISHRSSMDRQQCDHLKKLIITEADSLLITCCRSFKKIKF